MSLSRLTFVPALFTVVLALSAENARAECNCVAIAGDVAAQFQAEIAKADGLYARGDYSGALAVYARVNANAKDPSLLYAQAMAKWQLGANADAKALFEQYLAAGGNLAYRDRAEASLGKVNAGVSATVGGVVGTTGGVVGGVGGGVDAGAGVVGGVGMKATGKVKPGKTVGMVLGVVAVAAIGIIAVHSIRAGLSDEVELDFDPKFHLGLGVSGVVVGVSAIYVAGITAAAGAACAPGMAALPPRKPVVAPYATNGGGGLAAAMTF